MIKIYFSTISDYKELYKLEKFLNNKSELIPEHKWDKILSLRRKEEQLLKIYSSLLFRMYLYKDYDVTLDVLPISYNRYGRPFFSDINNLFFNFSYSKDIVACAISDKNIGIDVEYIEQLIDNDILKLFHPVEQKYLKNCNNQNKSIIKYWNLKESYLKFLGVGLSKGLDSFFLSQRHHSLYNTSGGNQLTIKNYTLNISSKSFANFSIQNTIRCVEFTFHHM